MSKYIDEAVARLISLERWARNGEGQIFEDMLEDIAAAQAALAQERINTTSSPSVRYRVENPHAPLGQRIYTKLD